MSDDEYSSAVNTAVNKNRYSSLLLQTLIISSYIKPFGNSGPIAVGNSDTTTGLNHIKQTHISLKIRLHSLLNNDLALHARALVRFAVVGVFASDIKLGGDLLSRSVQVVVMGKGIGVGTRGNGILIEDDVVREAGVVHPGNGIALGDGHGGGVENKSSCKQGRFNLGF